jgi:hypothetical protein
MSEFATESIENDSFTDDGAFPLEDEQRDEGPASTYQEATERVLGRQSDPEGAAELDESWLDETLAEFGNEDEGVPTEISSELDEWLQGLTDEQRGEVEERVEVQMSDRAPQIMAERILSASPKDIAANIMALAEEERPEAFAAVEDLTRWAHEQEAVRQAQERQQFADYATARQTEFAEAALEQQATEQRLEAASEILAQIAPGQDPDYVAGIAGQWIAPDAPLEERWAAVQTAAHMLASPQAQKAGKLLERAAELDNKPRKNYSDTTESWRLRREAERHIAMLGPEQKTEKAQPASSYEDATRRVLARHGMLDERAARSAQVDPVSGRIRDARTGRFVRRRGA